MIKTEANSSSDEDELVPSKRQTKPIKSTNFQTKVEEIYDRSPRIRRAS